MNEYTTHLMKLKGIDPTDTMVFRVRTTDTQWIVTLTAAQAYDAWHGHWSLTKAVDYLVLHHTPTAGATIWVSLA